MRLCGCAAVDSTESRGRGAFLFNFSTCYLVLLQSNRSMVAIALSVSVSNGARIWDMSLGQMSDSLPWKINAIFDSQEKKKKEHENML